MLTILLRRGRRMCGIAVIGLLAILATMPAAGITPAHGSQPVMPTPRATWFTGTPNVVDVLFIGDSTVAGDPYGGFRAPLSAELTAAGVAHNFTVAAISGTRCTYWSPRIHDLLALHNPDLVVTLCGTNDDTSTATARDQMGTAVRVIQEAIRTHRGEVSPVRSIAAYVQYSDPYNLAPALAWLPAGEERANAVLRTNLAYYLPHWSSLDVVDLSLIPGNPVTVPDGIHPGPVGQALYARMIRDAGARLGMWPASTAPAPCGLYGHAMNTPVPSFLPC